MRVETMLFLYPCNDYHVTSLKNIGTLCEHEAFGCVVSVWLIWTLSWRESETGNMSEVCYLVELADSLLTSDVGFEISEHLKPETEY